MALKLETVRETIERSEACSCGGKGIATYTDVFRNGGRRIHRHFRCPACAKIEESEFDRLPKDVRLDFLAVHGEWTLRVDPAFALRALAALRSKLELPFDVLSTMKDSGEAISRGTRSEMLDLGSVLSKCGIASTVARVNDQI